MVAWGSNFGDPDAGTGDVFFGQAVPQPGTNYIAIAASDFFSLAIQMQPPVLTIAQVGNNILTSWSTNHSGYTLETTTDLSSSLNWSNVPGTPTIIGKQLVLTNSITGGNQFFRLKK